MIKMCDNCHENESCWEFKLFHHNYGVLEEIKVCDHCLMEVTEKLEKQKILYIFDRVNKTKTKVM